ncbi:MAG: OmpA family protein [Ignavibacteria bacterium]|nr:OmpA family protein [Ignavibacteria bacterium]
MKIRYSSVVMLIIILFVGTAQAQSIFNPVEFTNRKLGLLNDASAVGWNPALLGINDNFDAVIGATLLPSGKLSGNYSAFMKIWKLGIGYIPEKDNLPQNIYFGFGVPIIEDYLWLGASVRNTEFSFNSMRYALSGIYSIRPNLLVSAGLGTVNEDPTNKPTFDVSTSYAPLFWLTFRAATTYSPNSIFAGQSTNSSVGGDIGLLDNDLIVSYNYQPEQQFSRIGLELKLGSITIGTLNNLSSNYNGGTLLVRFGSDEDQNLSGAVGRGRGSLSGGGRGSDADCNPRAIKWPATSKDSPELVISTMRMSSNSEYTDLVNEILSLSPTPNTIFDSIQQKYYSKYTPKSTVAGKIQNAIITREVEKVLLLDEQTTQTITTSTVQVKDQFGRNVSGLTKKNFSLTDTNRTIVSLSQTTAKTLVQADIVLLMDCSGSMSDEIQSIRTNVDNFVKSLSLRGIDYRIGGILYGEEIYSTLEPTTSVDEFSKFFLDASARGRDEVTSTAIHEATTMNFRPNAQRIFILITDDCSIQDNGDFSEPSLTREMWNVGAKLYSVSNPNNHNGAIMTRLSLGRDYNILKPFTTILDDISGDITTTYQLVSRPKEKVYVAPPKITFLRGTVTGEDGTKLDGTLTFLSKDKSNPLTIHSDKFNGEYETQITEGKIYDASVSSTGFITATDIVNLVATRKGDTVVKDFVLKFPVTTLYGKLTDQAGMPKVGTITIEDAVTLEIVKKIKTDTSGNYSLPIKEGKEYRLTAALPDYVATTVEADLRSSKRGDNIKKDLMVTAITVAIEQGMTFTLKNIFFDSGKWDLRPESEPEIEKLRKFMLENKSVRVEIGAHTDAIGKDEANRILSEKRAQSVMNSLASTIEISRMVAIGYGETKPKASNDTDEGRAQNRRVEFKLIK